LWCCKYDGYFTAPDIYDTWHADEMTSSCWGLEMALERLDEGTRFQLASIILRERKIEDARRSFRIVEQIRKKNRSLQMVWGFIVKHSTRNFAVS